MDAKKVVLLSMLVLGICTVATAQPDRKGEFKEKRRERVENKIHGIYTQLNLTPEQRKKLEDNRQNNREKRKELSERIRSYKEALNQEIMKPQLDMAKINEIQGSIKGLQAQMADDRLESILAVRKILTAEQFTQFITQVEKSRQEFRGKEEKE